MVSLKDIRTSNSRIASALPPSLVAIFVGATAGIGETSLKQFAKHARQARIYFVGRTQEAGDRIAAECKALNSEGEYIFIKADTSLIRSVDDVCRDIKSKEKAVNLLFLSTGAVIDRETPEGLPYSVSLMYYSRTRFIVNLLPLLHQATALRRVITVFAGGKEGPLDPSDFSGRKVSLISQRGHFSSLLTLSLEVLAKEAPDVAFIHNFPGPVKTNLFREGKGVAMFIVRALFGVIGPFIYIPNEEAGERHLFLSTSARYPAGASGDTASGVPLAEGVAVARGTSGKNGSGVYSVGWNVESSGHRVEELLTKFRKEGMLEKVWKHTQEEFKRITGVETA